jgi:hypothetical protein
VAAYARSRLGRRGRGWLALALLVAFAGGTVLTLVAGGRRTDSAYRRFSRDHLAGDVFVFPPNGPRPADIDTALARLAARPEVVGSMVFRALTSDGPTLAIPPANFGRSVNVPRVLAGRLPEARRSDEVAVTQPFASSHHLSVGGPLNLRLLGSQAATGGQPAVIPVTLRVVGIEVSPGDFPPQLYATSLTAIIATPALADRYRTALGPLLEALVVRLRRGPADVPAFEQALRQLPGSGPYIDQRAEAQATEVQRGIHVQAVALWLLAGFLALTGALILFQLLSRQAALAQDDHIALRALGMTRPQLWLSGMVTAATIGLVGAVMASVVAVSASPLLPLGTARLAESHTGFAFDAVALGLGALLILLAVPLLAAWPVWRASSRLAELGEDSGYSRPPLLARAAVSTAVSPAAAVGVGMALQSGRGRTAVPVRSSLVAVTLVVASLTTAFTFWASLVHLLDSPHLYGWGWDAHIYNIADTGPQGIRSLMPTLVSDRRIESVAIVDSPPLTVGRTAVSTVVLIDVRGHTSPVVLRGRAPEAPDEIALGVKTYNDTGSHLGSTVPVSITVVRQLRVPMRVVGVVVLPPENDAARFGVGAMVTGEGVASLIPAGVHGPPPSEAVVRFVPGANRSQLIDELGRAISPNWAVQAPQAPTDLINFGNIKSLPLILAGLLATLGLATLAHTLVSSVNRRARDMAVLKTLGFVPSQVRHVVAWQSTAFVAAALVIGLPIGVAVGRLGWDTFATQLGTLPEPVTPLLTLTLMVPAAIVLANLVAGVPGTIAARRPSALVLRSE